MVVLSWAFGVHDLRHDELFSYRKAIFYLFLDFFDYDRLNKLCLSLPLLDVPDAEKGC